ETAGLLLFKDLYGGLADLKAFFNGYHAYRRHCIKTVGGSLAYGSIQPEMKTALAALQEMYKRGEIDREFGVKDAGKVAEFAVSNRAGMTYGTMSIPIGYLEDGYTNDKADWQPYPIVSINDQTA